MVQPYMGNGVKTMIKTIDHIGIMTSDLKKSLKFYTDVLGFAIARKMEMPDAGLSVVFVKKGGSIIELMEIRGGKEPGRSKGIEVAVGNHSLLINDHITFSVDNIGETVAEYKEKGVAFTLEPVELQGGIKLASFKDPDGVLIELIEHA